MTNRYRARCMGRGRCGRGCDISASFHSPTALLYPARDTGRCDIRPHSVVTAIVVDDSSHRVKGVRVIDRKTRKTLEFRARTVVMAASTLSILPILIVFFFAQKYFVQGVVLTGIKG